MSKQLILDVRVKLTCNSNEVCLSTTKSRFIFMNGRL